MKKALPSERFSSSDERRTGKVAACVPCATTPGVDPTLSNVSDGRTGTGPKRIPLYGPVSRSFALYRAARKIADAGLACCLQRYRLVDLAIVDDRLRAEVACLSCGKHYGALVDG